MRLGETPRQGARWPGPGKIPVPLLLLELDPFSAFHPLGMSARPSRWVLAWARAEAALAPASVACAASTMPQVITPQLIRPVAPVWTRAPTERVLGMGIGSPGEGRAGRRVAATIRDLANRSGPTSWLFWV